MASRTKTSNKSNGTTEQLDTNNPNVVANSMSNFVEYFHRLAGDEKGEAHVFCDRLFQAFGHAGYKEAGATLEYRVKQAKSTKYADLLWKPRLLLEMKKRGEKLQLHYTQAFEYWLQLVPNRPRYVILCNFDEFWIYDFDLQLNAPVDTVKTIDLPERYSALNFLFPEERKPQFGNDLVAVTRAAADKVAAVFNALVQRGEDRTRAQRFVLQCVVAMFSEDSNLLPKNLFIELLDECLTAGASSYDLIGGLFRQMNNPTEARAGRYKGVRYFNGGVFQEVDPVELNGSELTFLFEAAKEKWNKVQPAIFGTIFQSSMDREERHAFGAHYTSEADIQKVILPTIIRPWREKIASAKTFKEIKSMLDEIRSFRVLDPACGSGNFLYVAYRELRRIELELIAKAHTEYKTARDDLGSRAYVSTKQFFGIDKNQFAVELAKVTMMLAKELALDEANEWLHTRQLELPIQFDSALPLDNLDANILCGDSLLDDWPKVNAIVGNPPFQSKNKMVQELGRDHVKRVREKYADVPGRADYCVYWFRRAHDELPPDGYAGLVGTNTIRQNYSREGGLDYIVENGGTITEAVSSQVWSGDAVVHVSIVNWVKGEKKGKKRLFNQLGDSIDSPWDMVELDFISSALSSSFDVTQAKTLLTNVQSEACYQGQTHGHEGFLLSPTNAASILRDPSCKDVVHPFLIGNDLLGQGLPSRFVIDLNACDDLLGARAHRSAFQHLEQAVMPTMKVNAEEEQAESGKKTGPRQSHFKRWWKFWRSRPEMIARVKTLSRYIVCVRHTKRPIFEFVHTSIHPNDSLQVFSLDDDYSFGVLHSSLHWEWFVARCSTIKRDPRYTSDSIFDTFPWPQLVDVEQIRLVADAAVALRRFRREIMVKEGWSLRELYTTLDLPGHNALRQFHDALDDAVRGAYRMKSTANPLEFLFGLNADLAQQEAGGRSIVGPGLPPIINDPSPFVTSDSIQM